MDKPGLSFLGAAAWFCFCSSLLVCAKQDKKLHNKIAWRSDDCDAEDNNLSFIAKLTANQKTLGNLSQQESLALAPAKKKTPLFRHAGEQGTGKTC